MIKWDLSQGCKDSSIYAIQCDTPYEQSEEEKPYDHVNRCRKASDKFQHTLLIKKTLQNVG